MAPAEAVCPEAIVRLSRLVKLLNESNFPNSDPLFSVTLVALVVLPFHCNSPPLPTVIVPPVAGPASVLQYNLPVPVTEMSGVPVRAALMVAVLLEIVPVSPVVGGPPPGVQLPATSQLP